MGRYVVVSIARNLLQEELTGPGSAPSSTPIWFVVDTAFSLAEPVGQATCQASTQLRAQTIADALNASVAA